MHVSCVHVRFNVSGTGVSPLHAHHHCNHILVCVLLGVCLRECACVCDFIVVCICIYMSSATCLEQAYHH